MTGLTERFWEDLLLFIEEGKVIPVVGPELVTHGDAPLTVWLARRLGRRDRAAGRRACRRCPS